MRDSFARRLTALASFARYIRLSYILLAIGVLISILVLPVGAQTSPPPVNLAQQGTIIAAVPIPTGGGNPSFEVIRDGVKPAVGSSNSQQQYDTFDGINTSTSDWIGYQFPTPKTFTQVVFQEGVDFDVVGQYDGAYGGWFSGSLKVQVLQGGVWVDVSAVSTPAYPGTTDYISYNTYTLNFPATTGTGIRIYGVPGGAYEFVSIGELEAYGYAAGTIAGRSLAKVSGDVQEGITGTTLPQPLTVQVYNHNGTPAVGLTLAFNVTSGGGSLSAQTTTTDANGRASVNWQLGQSVYPQPNIVTVSGSGLNTVTFTARGTGVTRIMPIGDSITQGCCIQGYDGYRRPLWFALNNANYSVNFVGSLDETYLRQQPTDDYDRNHEGHSGYRTDEILASINTWAQSAQPDVALIHLGTNDLNQGVSPSTAISNLSQIIDSLRAVNPSVKILLAKIQVPGSGTFNQRIGTLATQKNSTNSPVIVVDHTVGWNNSTDTYDTVHPSVAGSEKMANNWFAALTAAPPVAVTGVSVSPTSTSVAVNATTQLTATVDPANATNKTVTWASSNTSIATVNASGLVTGKAVGSAIITATTQDGGYIATSTVTVSPASAAVTGVSISPPSASVAVGGITQLTATITPANATNQSVTWSSSNPAVATVSSSGLVALVTGQAAGSATITVTTQDGGKTATSAITVNAGSGGSGSLTGTGASSTATVNLTTEGTSDWARWSSSYNRKSSGGSQISNYTTVGSGTVSSYTNDLRTLSWSDGTPTASGSNKQGIYTVGINNGFQITAPADLTQRTLKVYVGGWNSGGTLTAQLSDGSAANYVNTAYSGTGQYNAVYTLNYRAASAGQTVTVRWVQSSGSGNVTLQGAALSSVGAPVAVTGVSVSPASASVAVNATTQLTATVAPANATNNTVIWSSSNPSVATVNASGLVTGQAAGSATITVTTQDGGKTATSAITVNAGSGGSGSLTGTGASSTATVNLTTEGTSDWARWSSSYNRKLSGGSQISNYTTVGSGTVSSYTNDRRTLSWSDGTPTASGSNKQGIYTVGINNGFQITAPADLTQRTLKVYVGGWNSGGTLTAQLSDGSAANYVNTAYSGTGQYNAVYTLNYGAASAGQTVTVRWVQSSGSGNVTLQGAALK